MFLINHRGPDVKKIFASHIYSCLPSYGLEVFFDQPELQRGEKINPQIKEAIATVFCPPAICSRRWISRIKMVSRLALFICEFAEKSIHCIAHFIIETIFHDKTLKFEAIILPVFYNVRANTAIEYMLKADGHV